MQFAYPIFLFFVNDLVMWGGRMIVINLDF
nr:MAG TPA_asm: hypothetical protein [Caudoviricetes sp.]